MSTARFVLTPRGDFSLAAAIGFVHGFEPLSRGSEHEDHGETLRLAFCQEGAWEPVGIRARRSAAGGVSVTAVGSADAAQARAQVERMLSLDVDAGSLAEVVAEDGVAAALVQRFRGLRPVCFGSPYEAACWAVLSQRIRMTQAARIRRRMCDELGGSVAFDGLRLSTFPAPAQLVDASAIPGLPQVKVERLRAIAAAALDGRLDAGTLRAAGPERALADLRRLPGIGPFGAELVLIRGAGEPDHFARSERRLHMAMGEAYGVDPGDLDALAAIASRWRPFRSWIGFLFRAHGGSAAS